MNPVVKEQWVKDLRSGDFKQWRSQLHHEDEGYCCLGVLCDQAFKAGIVNRALTDDGNVYYDDADCYLPDAVVKWAGIPHNGAYDDGVEYDEQFTPGPTLASDNDDGASFSTIADTIEKYF
jgi:hypothetical protein